MKRGPVLFIALMSVAAALAVVWMVADDDETGAGPVATYVEAGLCFECHKDQQGWWTGSHHELAMQVATPESVAADFEQTEHAHRGVTTRFSRGDGGALEVEAQDADGEMRTFQVKYAFGIVPLQQYLVEFPDGRVQCLLTAWDTEKDRWFHLYDEPIPPGDELHWTGPLQNWNFMCAECHSTNLQRGYDPETDTYNTTWSEINVGCQACHGPGSEHVAWARAHEGQTGSYAEDDPMGLVVDLGDRDPSVENEHCARCHSRRSLVTPEYRHGDRFLDHYDLQLLVPRLYHIDGQILDEVYVYGSFLQSKKHAAGVRCSDCHDPHTARLRQEGNKLCVQCHRPDPPERFPTLRKTEYDEPTHHFHMRDSPGSFCVDCHMTDEVYMQVDPRRDHSFRVPRPDLSAVLGTPNACNGCHEDKGADWAATEVESWYPRSERRQKLHFAEAFAVADAGERRAPEYLAAVIGDEDTQGIVRATAVARIATFRGPIPQQVLEISLSDPDPLVRAAALEGLVTWVPPDLAQGLGEHLADLFGPLLSDEIRLVRTEAARAMAAVAGKDVPAKWREAFDRARREFVARQDAHADRAEGPFNMALLHESEGDTSAALAAYGRTIERFPHFVPARFNRAMLQNRLGNDAAAEADFRYVTERYPESGEAWYSLGLLMAEMKRYEDAATALTEAVRLMPERGRVRKNLGLALVELGREDDAERELLEAKRWIPNDPDLVHAIVALYVAEERWSDALRYAKILRALAPGNPEGQRLHDLALAKQGGR